MAQFYSFVAIITLRGFHAYKEATCLSVKAGDKGIIEIKSNPKFIAIDHYLFVYNKSQAKLFHWMENTQPYSLRHLTICLSFLSN